MSGTELSSEQQALLDLLENSTKPGLSGLLGFSAFQLVAYLFHERISQQIIFRCYQGKVNGEMFYDIGKRKPGLNDNPRWHYFSKAGITNYVEISRLTTIIENYHEV